MLAVLLHEIATMGCYGRSDSALEALRRLALTAIQKRRWNMSVIQDVIAMVQEKDAGQPEFHQAVKEAMTTLEPTVAKHPAFVKAKIYERIVIPDRAILFRVP